MMGFRTVLICGKDGVELAGEGLCTGSAGYGDVGE